MTTTVFYAICAAALVGVAALVELIAIASGGVDPWEFC